MLDISWRLYFFITVIVIFFFSFTLVIVFSFFSFFYDVYVSLFIVIVRYRSISSFALKSEELSTHLKTYSSLEWISDHVFLDENQGAEFAFVILEHESFFLEIVDEISVMSRNRDILRQLDIDIFFPSDCQFAGFRHGDKMIYF